MNCPKCGKKLYILSGGVWKNRGEVCENKKCWFYGIKRFTDKTETCE